MWLLSIDSHVELGRWVFGITCIGNIEETDFVRVRIEDWGALPWIGVKLGCNVKSVMCSTI